MDTKVKSSLLDKFLRLFSDVRAGEGRTAILLTLNVFILLSAYYIVKPVREALILSESGAAIKSYASAGQAVLLLIFIPVYAKLASRLPRLKLINYVTYFFMGCLALFYLLAWLNVPLGVVFFLWVGIFNVMIIAQFWSFANDVYTNEEGKRLFPIVAFGASAGAVGGSYITKFLIEPVGVYQLMLVTAAMLGIALFITRIIDRWERIRIETKSVAAKTAPTEESMGTEGAFKLVFTNKYLLMIALLILLLNWVNTTGEYILGETVATAAAQIVAGGMSEGLSVKEFIGKFYADFFGMVNILGLLIQLFLVSRIIKYIGIRQAILILPIIAFGGYLILAFFPILTVVRWAKTLENSTDYSLQNTVRHALFLPTTRAEKYKAKQVIDTFFWRAGDVMSAVLVFAGLNYLALTTRGFALVNLVLVGLWFLLALQIGKEYNRLTAEKQVSNAALQNA